MRNLLLTVLVVGQSLILLPSQAQIVDKSDQKANNPVSISSSSSSEAISREYTTPPAKSSNSESSSDNTKVIVSDSQSRESSVKTKPSSRIPIFSKIFNHPSMQQ